jgi:hypothetical protein
VEWGLSSHTKPWPICPSDQGINAPHLAGSADERAVTFERHCSPSATVEALASNNTRSAALPTCSPPAGADAGPPRVQPTNAATKSVDRASRLPTQGHSLVAAIA